MKLTNIIIFVSVVLIIYTAANYYIYIRGRQALPDITWARNTYKILFAFLSLSFVVNIFLTRLYPSFLCDIFTWTGYFWLGAMLYLFLFILLFDILRGINHFIPFFPEYIKNNYDKVKLYSGLFTLASTAIILIFGYINANTPVVKELNIDINKKAGNLKTLKIVAVSDIHIGNVIRNSKVNRLADKINSLNPDIVLMPGDILDEAIEPVLKYKSGDPLKDIKSRYGIYAVTGNHEYIGGVNDAVPYLKSLGINLLRDSSALVDNAFYIIGREDRDSKRFAGRDRKSVGSLTEGLNKDLPMILLDHQPFHLDESAEAGIDLQISGHTHHGQIWPFNYITGLVYELSWGYLQKGSSHFYVSSGYGTWGPPIRTGNTPEIVVFNLRFE